MRVSVRKIEIVDQTTNKRGYFICLTYEGNPTEDRIEDKILDKAESEIFGESKFLRLSLMLDYDPCSRFYIVFKGGLNLENFNKEIHAIEKLKSENKRYSHGDNLYEERIMKLFYCAFGDEEIEGYFSMFFIHENFGVGYNIGDRKMNEAIVHFVGDNKTLKFIDFERNKFPYLKTCSLYHNASSEYFRWIIIGFDKIKKVPIDDYLKTI